MKSLHKTLVPVPLLATVLFIGAGTIHAQEKSSRQSEPQQDIKITKAMIKIVESVDVPVERAGVVTELNVREGQIIKKGQVVGQIDDATYQIRLAKAKVELEIAQRRTKDSTLVEFAKKTAEVSQAELKRAKNANQSVELAVSDTEMDRLALVVAKSKLEIEKAQIDFDVAQLTEKLQSVEIEDNQNEIAKHQIKSPIDGLVVKVDKAKGEWADPGERAFRMVRINRLRIEGKIRVDLAVGLKNREVKIQVELPNKKSITRTGKVVFVSPEANPVSRTVPVWVEFDNSDSALWPGLQGTIIIPANESAVPGKDDTDTSAHDS